MRIINTILLSVLFLTASVAFSAELDDYYLAQFGERPSATMKAASVTPARRCGMPLRRGLKRDWAALETSTRNTLAKYLGKPILSGEATSTSSGGHFVIHYATSGTDLPVPVAPYTLSSWIQAVADTFEQVYTKEAVTDGYSPPPDLPYDVYLQQLGTYGEFGYTQSEFLIGQSASSYIVVDNDFSENIFQNSIPGADSAAIKSLKSLQITAAHEFHHAIQFGYNYYFDSWYAEATSTWMEDEVFDQVNQLYDYSVYYLQTPSLSLDTPVNLNTGGGYGRWIFNRFLAERHGTDFIRAIWTKLGQTIAQNGNDIPMLPVIDSTLTTVASTMPDESLRFGMRLYERNWVSHTSEISLLYQHPLTINATYNTYPVTIGTIPMPSVTLPNHHALAFFRFLPSGTPPSTLLLVFDQKPSTLSTVAIRKLTDGTFQEYPFDAASYTITIPKFSDATTAEVMLVIDNISELNNQTAQFSNGLTVTASVIGSGSGTVNSDPAGITCANGSATGCTAPFPSGTTVNLFATPDAVSLFSGWGGECSGQGSCSLTVTSDKTVTASFTAAFQLMVGNKSFSALQAAYDDSATTDGSTIKLREGALPGNFTAGRGIAVKLEGGYNALYSAIDSETAIQGRVNLRGGTVRMQGIRIR